MKIFLFIILMNISSITSLAYDDLLKAQLNDLNRKVDELLTACRNETNSTVRYEKAKTSSFLHNNTSFNPYQNNTNIGNSTSSSFLSKLKSKIQKFFHIKQDAKNKDAAKVKRCLSKTVGRNGEKINVQMSSDDELKTLLRKFFKCLSMHGGFLFNTTEESNIDIPTEPPTLFDINVPTNSTFPVEEEEIKTKTEALLRYLASSKHSVEEVGRPKYKKPNLEKIKEIIDNAKSAMWMSFEVEEVSTMTTTTTEEYENVPELPILKREISKLKNENSKKDKRNGLFKGIINSVNDFQYEVPDVSLKLESKQEKNEQPDEINKLVEKIDYKQQEDLLKFIDQLNEKPKEFKFDIEKYFMQAFENLTRFKDEKTEENDDVGPKKYFEFESGDKRKRHIKDKRIERLRKKFIDQYKNHRHENYVDFRKTVEHIHDNHADNTFLDKTYRLNDGSIKTSDLVKPLHINNAVKSPKEVKMDIELSEKFNEIEENDFHSRGKTEMESRDSEVPYDNSVIHNFVP